MFAYAHKYQGIQFRRSDPHSHVLAISYGYHIWICSLFPIGNSDQLLKIFSVSPTFCLWGHGCILLCPTIVLHIGSNFWNSTNVSDLPHRLRPSTCFTCPFSLREIPGWNLWALFCRNFNIGSIPFCLVFRWEALKDEKTFTVPLLFGVFVFHCPSLW